jgi:hypothetical protein
LTISQFRKTRREATERTRQQVLRNAEEVCHYCGCQWASEADHVRPDSQGGAPAAGNLVAACFRCNHEKRGRTPAEWKRWRLDHGKAWPPRDCTTVIAELALGMALLDIGDLHSAIAAQDDRVLRHISDIHDRYHAGKPKTLETDRDSLLAVVAEFLAERVA